MTNDAAQPPLDVREAGLRAVLAFHDRGMTAASLRAIVSGVERALGQGRAHGAPAAQSEVIAA